MHVDLGKLQAVFVIYLGIITVAYFALGIVNGDVTKEKFFNATNGVLLLIFASLYLFCTP